jgi:hypothetical protein
MFQRGAPIGLAGNGKFERYWFLIGDPVYDGVGYLLAAASKLPDCLEDVGTSVVEKNDMAGSSCFFDPRSGGSVLDTGLD